MVDSSQVTAAEVTLAKQELRSTARRIRAELFQHSGEAAAEEIAAHGISFTGASPGAVVSGFWAIEGEIDPLPLMLRLAEQGFELALPMMGKSDEPLRFRRWQPDDPTTERKWGIHEPLTSAPEVAPDVMLVPLLAFDAEGHRLGYGGGFYDRTLAAARAGRAITAIGLAYDKQEVPAVPRLHFDQRLDWVLTPSGPRRCDKS